MLIAFSECCIYRWYIQPWSSVVEGGEGLYLPNHQTDLVIAPYSLSLLFCKFINIIAYHLGRYEPSSPISCRAPQYNTRHCLCIKCSAWSPTNWLLLGSTIPVKSHLSQQLACLQGQLLDRSGKYPDQSKIQTYVAQKCEVNGRAICGLSPG